MADIKDQLIKDSYNYVLQSDIVDGKIYRIGGSIPVNPKFLSGLTINSGFTYSNGTEQDGYVLISDSQGNANWFPSTGLTTSGLTYYVQSTLPPGTGYTNGDRWFDTSTGDELVWIIDNPLLPGVWVQPNNGGGGGGGSSLLGSGTTNYLAVWGSQTTLSSSTIYYDGTNYNIPSLSAGTITSQNYQGNLVNSLTNGDSFLSVNNNTGDILIYNEKPDLDVVLTDVGGIGITGVYPNFSLSNTDKGSDQNIFKNIQIDDDTKFSASSNNSDLNFSGIGITITSDSNKTLIFSAGTSSQSVSGDYLPLSGGTVTGDTIFQSGVTANTISATTYFNLPVSGLTSGNGIGITNNNNNFTIAYTGSTGISGDYLPLSGGTVTGDTIFQSGVTANTISATTYFNLPVSGLTSGNGIGITNNNNNFTISYTGSTGITGDYLPLSGGTVSGNTYFTSGLTASTLTVTGNTILANTSGTSFYTNYIDFNLTAATSSSIGRLRYDKDEGGLVTTMIGGNVDLKVGQENVVYCYNGDSVILTKGQIVSVNGNQGNRPRIVRAVASAETTSSTAIGVVSETIDIGSEGFVTTFGPVRGFQLTGITPGSYVYLSPNILGGFTGTQPQAPQHIVAIGYVVRTGNTQGEIFVNINNGWEINELHNVRITNATNNDILQLSAGTPDIWINVSEPTLNGLSVTGNTSLQSLTATTISATTYFNLPVSGLTSGAGISVTNNNNNFTIAYTGSTGITGEYLPLSGGTVTGGTIFQSGLTATTISATTYYNLPPLYQLTGGTYSAGTIDFKNTTGGTSFSVTGLSKYFVTGSTPTGISLNNGDRWFDTNSGIEVVWITDVDGSQWIQPSQGGGSASGNYLPLSGGTVTGGTIFQSGVTANTISATSITSTTLNVTSSAITFSNLSSTNNKRILTANNLGQITQFSNVIAIDSNSDPQVYSDILQLPKEIRYGSAYDVYNLKARVNIPGGTNLYINYIGTVTNNTSSTFIPTATSGLIDATDPTFIQVQSSLTTGGLVYDETLLFAAPVDLITVNYDNSTIANVYNIFLIAANTNNFSCVVWVDYEFMVPQGNNITFTN